jgi:[ribosomal protein S5]-alanine N-acetyltransferase
LNDDFPILKTSSLLLLQVIKTDLENVFKGLSHPDVIKYYGVNFNSLEETERQMSWFAKPEKNGKSIWWAICSKDNTSFYGAGGLGNGRNLPGADDFTESTSIKCHFLVVGNSEVRDQLISF